MDEAVYQQISNVATLPGIARYALCMPDGHSGYGFPIGGVAAMDVHEGGVISPGGIGFDINCGMRLITTNLTLEDVQPRLKEIVDRLFQRVRRALALTDSSNYRITNFETWWKQGARWCVERDLGWQEDLEFTEENGCIAGADASKISERAVERGYNQVGTLGSGNHYLEVQVARPEDVRDKELAKKFGITIPNQIVVMFHCGSRGFGHQVATDYLQKVLESNGAEVRHQNFGSRTRVRAVRFTGRPRLFRRDEMRIEYVVRESAGNSSPDPRSFFRNFRPQR
jgi:Uncharacterized conserved protein